MMKISEMPKYEVYKDSGVEWLGDIPASWSLLANKHIFRLKKKQVGKRSSEYDLLSLTLRGVIKRDMENPEGKFPAEFDTYQEVQCGDFIFCLFDVEETPRTVGLSPFNGMITGAYTVFELNDNFDNRFLYYFYMNLDAKKMLKPLYRGLRNTIPKDSFLSFKTFVPPHEQQTRIANFLDKKTALIDEAISIKEQQISLLKERKQIIIQQAVTQGLDPNVPMKDSGVDWIGKVPAHWEVKKMKFIFDSIQTGTTPVTSEPKYFDGDVDWYNPKDLNAGYLDKSEKTISELAIKHGQAKIFPGDSVLIVGIGATCGKTAYLKSSSAFNQQITGFSSRHENAEFMYYLISMYSSVMLKVANYTTLPILNNEFFKHFLLPCPSKIEQDRIVGFLRIETLKFEKTIEIQLQQIERLKEYKTTLINSAVTGKIKITPEMVEQ
ncbi:TPA: restriction endonuclease subunit S [Escherichia coli]|uniref:restriction endonuclease subunit S n=1 Tax=Escherichia coli TaxID=562 RepID=UPI0018091EF4|nr:restriction endonuclease subunit S [Escherichia coli]EFH7621439.1 restriction endonuclease subunit S [Escherichia coli]EFO0396966.1 restriction endonuclease subunit S [Escherichia coli]EHL6307386.1 restriction endonuclease subunit S [Escherichia coli]EHO7043487.1 restriction endonuclease subunit S [Escherichia coli]